MTSRPWIFVCVFAAGAAASGVAVWWRMAPPEPATGAPRQAAPAQPGSDARRDPLSQRELPARSLRGRLDRARADLLRLRDAIDRLAGSGKWVDKARVYWTALDWCAGDIDRCLAAEEPEIVHAAGPLLDALEMALADPQRVLRHAADAMPKEGDPLRAAENPFFRSVVRGATRFIHGPRTWPQGQAGRRAVSDAWEFRRIGDDVLGIVWAATQPHSDLRHRPILIANALNFIDAVARLHVDGDFNVGRQAAHGYDANINRFCLAPALDAWGRLGRAYPDLLPRLWKERIEAGLRTLVDRQAKDYGRRLAAPRAARPPLYPNMDAHYLLIMELAHQLWNDPRYAHQREAILAVLAPAVYPMGGLPYVDGQNESFGYHQVTVVLLARYWQLTGDERARAILAKTIPYYPYNVEPVGMPESCTDPSWKHYWEGAQPQGPAIIAGLFDDPLNQRVAEICGPLAGYGRGPAAAVAAECWKPIASKPLPDGYVIFDPNVQGPRGRFGPWSFAANGRDYGPAARGKDTFVGAMLCDPARRPLPLDAAIQAVTAEVRLDRADPPGEGGCLSANEHASVTHGPDFGSLAVVYRLSRPGSGIAAGPLLDWRGTQVWCLSKTRLVGLVAVQSTADQRAAAVHGRIRLGLGRELQPAGDFWKYGRLRVKIHDHNYAAVEARRGVGDSEKPPLRRSDELTLIDPASRAGGPAGEVSYPNGVMQFFLVEVFPEDSAPARKASWLDRRSLVSLSVEEADRRVVVWFNAGPQAAEFRLPPLAAGEQCLVYRDAEGRGLAAGSAEPIRLEPYGHLTAVVQSIAAPPARPAKK